MTVQSYSDQQLEAYLDGSVSEEDAAAIEHAISRSPELEQRLLALEPLSPIARDAFAEVPSNERLRGLLPPETTQQSPRRVAQLSLVACLAGAIGFALATLTVPSNELGWREQIAVYQALYVPETIEAIVPTDAELNLQFIRGSDVLGREVRPDMLAGLDELDLRRAQVLQSEQQTIVQIVFAGPQGEPFAFCIVALNSETQNTDMEFEQLAGVPTAHWVEDDYGYMLVGRVAPEVMRGAAQKLRAIF